MAKKISKVQEAAIYGGEPVWGELDTVDQSALKRRIADAYNWYSYMCTHEDHVNYTYAFLGEHNRESRKMLKAIKRLPGWKIPEPLGWIARMMSRGLPLTSDNHDWFNLQIYRLYDEAKKVKVKRVVADGPVQSVRDRMLEKVGEHIADLEEELDKFVTNGYKSEFSMYAWLKDNDIKGKPAGVIADFYKPFASEMVELNGRSPDPALVEGYIEMSKADRKRLLKFIQMFMRDLTQWTSNKKTTRKPRKARSVSAVKTASGVTVMPESDEYRVVSVDPANIVGAQVAWVFNTRNRVLARYEAEGPGGLTISRSSIRSFNNDSSYGKKLRDPGISLPIFKERTKVATRKLLDQTKAKPSSVTGRLNKTMILLKVEK